MGVSDGDTITLLDAQHHQHKIGLDGIGAPESRQPFGGASKRHLSELAVNREAVAECHKTDRYGREVCRVLVGGTDVCLDLPPSGYASSWLASPCSGLTAAFGGGLMLIFYPQCGCDHSTLMFASLIGLPLGHLSLDVGVGLGGAGLENVQTER